MELTFAVVPAVLLLAVWVRLSAGSLDRDRIRRYIATRNGRMIAANWSPFGPGWFGDERDRIYRVSYIDADGNRHQAYCKTSLWSGVYFTQDRVIGQGKTQGEPNPFPANSERFLAELSTK